VATTSLCTNVLEASRGSACGKAILLGEHAVVYGVPALAVGIERGVQAASRPARSPVCELTVRSWDLTVTEYDERELGRALRALVAVSRPKAPREVEAIVDLPPGGGLGCSAALGVAVARALDPEAPAAAIEARVMAWERVFHGNPSGVDAAAASRGGCVQYTKGGGLEAVRLAVPLALCIGHSGASSRTGEMVERVAHQRAERREAVTEAFQGIRSLVQGARAALESGDRAALGRLMDLNQVWLADLQLSTPAIDRMCRLARDHGALGAKLTGAGGGGCVVALVGGGRAAWQVLDAWRGAGFEGFVTRVASAGSSPDLASEVTPRDGSYEASLGLLSAGKD
jgi:mevalonate kinase